MGRSRSRARSRSRWLALFVCVCAAACASAASPSATSTLAPDAADRSDATSPPVPEAGVVLRGAEVIGVGSADVWIRGHEIVAVGLALSAPGAAEHDVTGRFIVPAFIDSHVHLAYLPIGPMLARGGVGAAVDLASPLEFLAADHAPLHLLGSGPMITRTAGYPTTSWGRDGYGLECDDAARCTAAVELVHARGARVVKVPLAGPPVLDDDTFAAVVARAHALGMKVATHALDDESARRAARLGVDVLAHTPVEPLSDDTVQAWRSRAVVSTLRAFGGAASTVDNLRRLRAAGATVLYGTDLGNTSIPGIDRAELALLSSAGLDGDAILASATSAPAAYWGFAGLGAVTPGRAASLLVLDRDPRRSLDALAAPVEVWLEGDRLSSP